MNNGNTIKPGIERPTDTHRIPVAVSQGLMYQNPKNPQRWMLDGKPFYPIGFGDCVYVRAANNEILMGFDGEATPKFTDLDTYFSAYSAAGFNFLRVSVNNCSFELNSEANWLLMDKYIAKARSYGFQIQFCFFNYYFYGNQLEYVRRCIKRYDKDVAIWELANETQSTDAEITSGVNYVKSIDPKKRPVTVSFHPTNAPTLHDIPAIDLTSPHWYQEDKSEFSFDQDFVDRFAPLKNLGKPVIIGEYGLRSANWSPVSALQLRLASWSAFFNEVGLCFWNTSWDKNHKTEGAANIYLGKQERSFIEVLSNYTKPVPGDALIANISVNKPASVRAFALSSRNGYFAYLHAFTNHQSQTSGTSITIEPKTAGYATWIEPATGRVLATGKVLTGRQTLTVPPFLIDVALKISSSPSTKK
jgi:hypothetical protein